MNSNRKIRVKRETEDPMERLNMAAIKSEVTRQTRELKEKVDVLEERVKAGNTVIGILQEALIDVGNTCEYIASDLEKTSTKNSVRDFVNGLVTDLSGLQNKIKQLIDNVSSVAPGVGAPTIDVLYIDGVEAGRDGLGSSITETSDEDEDIIGNLSDF